MIPVVRFIYESDDYELQREIVAKNICQFVATELELPNEIQIVFAKLNESYYGSTIINPRFKNRLTINNMLKYNEITEAVVHELIHIHQVKIGRLSSTSNGIFVWDNRQYINIENYNELPWEQDVVNKQHFLLPKTRAFLTSTPLK